MSNVTKKRQEKSSVTSTEGDSRPINKAKPAGNGTGARPLANQVSPYVDSTITQLRELQKKKQQLPPVRSLDETKSKRATLGTQDDPGMTPVDQGSDGSRSRTGVKSESKGGAAGIGIGDVATTKVPTKKQPKEISVKPRQAEVETSQTGSDVVGSKAEVKRSRKGNRKSSDGAETGELEPVMDLERSVPSVQRKLTEPQNQQSVSQTGSDVGSKTEADPRMSGLGNGDTKEDRKEIIGLDAADQRDGKEPSKAIHTEAVDQSFTEEETALRSYDETSVTPLSPGDQGTGTVKAFPRFRLTEQRLDGDGAAEVGDSGGESDVEGKLGLSEQQNKRVGTETESNDLPPMETGAAETDETVDDPRDDALSQIPEEESRSERERDSARRNSDAKESTPSEVMGSTEWSDGKIGVPVAPGQMELEVEEREVVEENTEGKLETGEDGKTEAADKKQELTSASNISASESISDNNDDIDTSPPKSAQPSGKRPRVSTSESVSTNSDDIDPSPSRSVQSSKRPRGSTSATFDGRTRQEMRSILKKRETAGKLEVRSSSEDTRSPARSGGLAVPKPEAGSVLPKNSPVPAGSSRLLTLSRRGEWSVVDQLIRAMEKGNEEINYADEVIN